MFIIFSQQILCGKCLFVVTSGKKSNLSIRFKLELITIYYL